MKTAATPRRVYVTHAITGTVLYYAGGENDKSMERAIDYAIRRHALMAYIAMRRRDRPNVYEPLKIMARAGRRLLPGQSIAPARGKWRMPQGEYTSGALGPPPEEIVSVWPLQRTAARRALERRYPNTWRRYEHRALVFY